VPSIIPAPTFVSPTMKNLLPFVLLASVATAADEPEAQYSFGDISIPAASAEEPRRADFSAAAADEYLHRGAVAWMGARDCIACHTTGLYLQTRPALTPFLGPPDAELRAFFVEKLDAAARQPLADRQKGVKPAQAIYLALGLAEWDAHLSGKTSAETERALAAMFELQLESGTWGSLDCWPPYESDAYHLAATAALAVATVPGRHEDPPVERLRTYLRTTPPPHDYGRVLLLHAAARMNDLLPASQRDELIAMVARHQRPDGGWSIRTFAAPEAWGHGNRADKLKAEPDFGNPASDGHMTGYAIVVLREAGVAADDPRIRRGLDWLKLNQRESGRWWTRSLNTDKSHFITYSGTAFPLLALGMCHELPRRTAAAR
jgi:squalene-hopene/tetraprenyl-beta-curcumene cyclase